MKYQHYLGSFNYLELPVLPSACTSQKLGWKKNKYYDAFCTLKNTLDSLYNDMVIDIPRLRSEMQLYRTTYEK